MRRYCFGWICLLVWVSAAVPALAQEGHPLTGTWAGDWGPTATQRTHVTFVLNWDGKNVTGTLNPGPNAVPIANVYVDWATWTVHIEADTKDQAGNAVHIAAEGKVEDIGSYHRKIAGTWRQGAAKGDFRITRD
ncbi:MAG TPA: hypothetical protein VG096_09485 [Bryobacteraceae bacterium]|jgi:hypothetical protein|nr:hypothetical protein [Bryobacteraceae bacterium]